MEEAARVEPRPDRDWVQGLSGAYVNQDLGRVVVREAEEGGILEAAQWEASFGRKLEKDGVVKLVVTTRRPRGSSSRWGEGRSPVPHSRVAPATVCFREGVRVTRHEPFQCLYAHFGRERGGTFETR
jgi:hypothetical protein